MNFTLRRLKYGALCLADDQNFPDRAEACGHFDVDGDKHTIAEKVGLHKGSVVVDAGAFVGDTALIFARHGAKVYAYEPFFDTYVCLAYNTRNLDVVPLNWPTGNGEKVKLVYECPGHNFGMRSVCVVDEKCTDAITTARIDDLNLEKCDFMKIDVEGREIPTLMGAAQTIERCKPILFIEHYVDGLAKQGYSANDLVRAIESLGYDMEMFGEQPRWDWICRPKA